MERVGKVIMIRKLSEYKALSEIENNEEISRPVYIVSLDELVNRTGKKQVNLGVRDGYTQEQIAIFDSSVFSLTRKYPFLKVGSIVKLYITRKEPYYNADRYMEEITDEFDLSDIADIAVDNPYDCYEHILEAVDEASYERNDDKYAPLNTLVRYIYSVREHSLLTSSSAVTYHHTGIGGNILHTVEVVDMCEKLLKSSIAQDVDKELLLAAAALHDVGKIECYSTDEIGVAEMTLDGYAYGGHHLSSIRAIEEAAEVGNYDPERIKLLVNIIACHHGSREAGDLATPLTIEGYWLHAMDDLNAKHYEAVEEIKTLEPGAVSKKKAIALGTRLYRRTDQEFNYDVKKEGWKPLEYR